MLGSYVSCYNLLEDHKTIRQYRGKTNYKIRELGVYRGFFGWRWKPDDPIEK